MAIIGRENVCDIVIPYAGISARHAMIEYVGPHEFLLKDLGSVNGVFVNGRRFQDGIVRDGDDIRLGNHPFDVRVHAARLEQEFHARAGVTIGRGPGVDIQVDDARVSSRHAMVMREGDHLLVVDLGSRNGIFVNGQVVSRGLVRPGDRVSFGSHPVDLFQLLASRQQPRPSDLRQPQPGPPWREVSPAPPPPPARPVPSPGQVRPPAQPVSSRGLLIAGVVTLVLILAGVGAVFATSQRIVRHCEDCQAVAFERRAFYWNRAEVEAQAGQTHYCEACGNKMVEIHHRKKCKNCGQIYQDDVVQELRRVGGKDTEDASGYCQPCGDEPVQIVIQVKCRNCGKLLTQRTESWPRRLEKQGGDVSEDICLGCRLTGAVEEGGRVLDHLFGR